MMHLDIEVDDLDAAAAAALGARVAEYQPRDNIRVLLDPAGHPFCLCRDQDLSGPPGLIGTTRTSVRPCCWLQRHRGTKVPR